MPRSDTAKPMERGAPLTPPESPIAERDLHPLVRHAIMAPSSHNTQPWRFRLGPSRIDVLIDRDRWLAVADPDQRELRLSVGAALENLLLAAEQFGFRSQVVYFPDPTANDWVARVSLTRDPKSRRPSLFAAIGRRQTNRRPYIPEVLPEGLMEDLEAITWDSGIWARTSTDQGVIAGVADLVARGDRIEYADPAFRRELGEWIGRGLLGLPRPLAGLTRFAVTRLNVGSRIASRDAALVRQSGGLLVVVTKADDAVTQVRAGRALQRVWLLATQFGLCLQPMSQPLEVPELRRELAALIGAGEGHPQHLFRIGFGEPENHRAGRRSLEEVLVSS